MKKQLRYSSLLWHNYKLDLYHNEVSGFCVVYSFCKWIIFRAGTQSLSENTQFWQGTVEKFTNPQLGGEEQLIRDIESFTDLLLIIRDKIKAGNKTVIQQVQPFIPQKTPIFLSHPLDEDNLKSVFKWDEEDLDVLFHVSKHSQLLWDEIKYWYGKIVTGNETFIF